MRKMVKLLTMMIALLMMMSFGGFVQAELIVEENRVDNAGLLNLSQDEATSGISVQYLTQATLRRVTFHDYYGVEVAQAEVLDGDYVLMPDLASNLDGHTFSHWFDGMDENMQPYAFGMPVTSDLALYPFYFVDEALSWNVQHFDETNTDQPVYEDVHYTPSTILDTVEPEGDTSLTTVPATDILESMDTASILDMPVPATPATDAVQQDKNEDLVTVSRASLLAEMADDILSQRPTSMMNSTEAAPEQVLEETAEQDEVTLLASQIIDSIDNLTVEADAQDDNSAEDAEDATQTDDTTDATDGETTDADAVIEDNDNQDATPNTVDETVENDTVEGDTEDDADIIAETEDAEDTLVLDDETPEADDELIRLEDSQIPTGGENDPYVTVDYTVDQENPEGAVVTLTATVHNLPEGLALSYQWQNDETGEFSDVQEATSATYTFLASAYDAEGYNWRVNVDLLAA